MVVAGAVPDLIRELARRGAHEVELYEALGFPDGFGRGDSHVQTLVFEHDGEGDGQVTLFGGRVVGHPHEIVAHGEWDGVTRPRSMREFRHHIQTLSRSVRPGSPLGAALIEIERGGEGTHDASWRRAVHWWAMTQSTARPGLAERLTRFLATLGGDEELRLAAELLSPHFARDVLVASHRWPPSERAISSATLAAAIPRDWTVEHHVVCLSIDDPSAADDLGTIDPGDLGRAVELECATFAEPSRATSCVIGWGEAKDTYALTGDGDVWRQAAGSPAEWILCGPANVVLVATREVVEARLEVQLRIIEAEHPTLQREDVRTLIREHDFGEALEILCWEAEDRGITLTERSREAFMSYARESGMRWNLTYRDFMGLRRDETVGGHGLIR